MNHRTRRARPLLGLALVFLIVPTPSGAEWSAWEAGGLQPSTVSVYGSAIDFAPSVDYRQAVLTISRGDVTFRKVFAAGERPTIDLFDPEGNYLADGVYAWELELLPDAKTAQALREAASVNGGEAPGAWRPESGAFAIAGGAFVSPDVTEPSPVRDQAAVGLLGAPASSMAPSSFGSARRRDALDSDASGESEQDVQAAAANRAAVLAPAAGAAGVGPDRAASGDSDGEVLAMGMSLEEPQAFEASPARRDASALEAQRSIDPTGANGRPRSEEEQR